MQVRVASMQIQDHEGRESDLLPVLLNAPSLKEERVDTNGLRRSSKEAG